VVSRNNVLLAAISTLSLTVIGALLSNVFSPLSENLKDAISPVADPKDIRIVAKVFNNTENAVTKPIDNNTGRVPTAITFWFNTTKRNNTPFMLDTPLIKIQYPSDKQYFLSKPYALFPENVLYQFECSIDGQPFEQCTSPKPYGNLQTEVMHIFKVRAKGILGNTQDEPTTFIFTTVTLSNVEGFLKLRDIVKNQTIPAINANVTVEGIPKKATSDAVGYFAFDGIGQGTHKMNITVGPAYYNMTFFVTPALPYKNLGDILLDDLPKGTIPNSSNKNISQRISEPSTYNRSETNPAIKQTSNKSSATHAENISIKQESIQLPDNPNFLNTTVSINASSKKIIPSINSVTYYLHPTFNPDHVTSTTHANNFTISFTNWGIFDLNAKVVFNNGTAENLMLPINQWHPPKKDVK
jgi:YEATS family